MPCNFLNLCILNCAAPLLCKGKCSPLLGGTDFWLIILSDLPTKVSGYFYCQLCFCGFCALPCNSLNLCILNCAAPLLCKGKCSPFSAVLNLYICQFCVSAFQFGVIVIRQVLLLPFALPIRSGKDKPYLYGACNLRVADCGCYAARCDGNTCRIVKCLNKITAVRCASQILSAPLASGTTKHRKIHGLQPSSHRRLAVHTLTNRPRPVRACL